MTDSNGNAYQPSTTTTDEPSNWREITSFMANNPYGMLVNSLVERSRLAERYLSPSRSINQECGYPDIILPEMYEEMWTRDPIARRVVEVLPLECLQVQPVIYESEDPDITTDFEDTFMALGEGLRGEESFYRGDEGNPLMEYILRTDIQAGKGRYSLLFMGLDDNSDNLASEPTSASKLLYLRVFPETAAPIGDLETTPGPRLGQPLNYDISFNDPADYNRPGSGTTLGPVTEQSVKVHWKRVIHVADGLEGNEVFGTPRMEPVFNRLLDLRKLYGASPEMYWKGGFGGYSIEAAPGIDPTEVAKAMTPAKREELKNNMEEYMEGLKKFVLLIGLQMKSHAPQVVDPTPHIMVQLQAIAMKLGMPMRILMGSERGNLSSTQDLQEWHDRIRFRQQTFITPRILVPLIDRLISLGVLAAPKKIKRRRSKFEIKRRSPAGVRPGVNTTTTEGGYTIWWPDITSQTDEQKANHAFKLAQALAVYAEKAVQWIMPPRQFFNIVVGLSEDEARGVAQASEEYNQQMGHDPAEAAAIKTGTQMSAKDQAAQDSTNKKMELDANKPKPVPVTTNTPASNGATA